mgnify:CR=1 FL=1
MTENSIPSSLRDLLYKGNYIANFKRNHKPNVITMTDTNSDSMFSIDYWFGPYNRWKGGEGKNVTIEFIEKISDQLIFALNEYTGTKFMPLILDTLRQMKVGINNLNETTYKDHPPFTNRAKIILDNIQIQLDDHK